MAIDLGSFAVTPPDSAHTYSVPTEYLLTCPSRLHAKRGVLQAFYLRTYLMYLPILIRLRMLPLSTHQLQGPKTCRPCVSPL
ncbi:hypothetical protein IF1G_04679 [Cordyceps javanica]|uniref:Uncharacterized protein n=1 Tax=Cordyceps javanica TaxID=43265 RepID=A0A545V301_9HYPO|nr:hypothetical protein IF1G_04679 [Cordyceps javanica]